MTQDARDINFNGRVDRNVNNLEAEAGTLWGDTGVGILGRWLARVYGSEVPSWEDLNEFSLNFFARWIESEDYAYTAEFDLLRREYRGSVLNDSTTYTALVGIEGTPLDDLQYFVKVGVAALKAQDTGTVDDDSSLLTVAGEGQVRFGISTDIAGRVWYVQRPEYATYSNYQMAYRGGFTVDWLLDSGWYYVRGLGYIEYATPSNEPNLMLYVGGIAAGTEATDWLKIEAGWEWKKRLGEGTTNYVSNQAYIQAAVYF
jgi:hypothetical protein